ncbi:MAG: pilus assembly protein PilM [Candidatus Nomurabacteria bacterium]|nr:pilus assembly protein PilM [Candidatus Nomurabacteria bacterium]
MLNRSYNKFFPLPDFLSKPSFGLDISDESIKFIEILQTHKGLHIGKYGEKKFPAGIIGSGKIIDSKRLKDILLELKKVEGMNSARVSLPEEQVYLFKLKIPREKSINIREAIELSLEEYVPIPPADIIFDYELFSEDDQNFEVQVSAVPKQIIEGYISVFKDCNLDAPSFELEAQAGARSIVKDGDNDTYMIVDFGNDRTGLSVVSNGMVVFTSTLDIGGILLTRLIEKNFKVSFAEAEAMKLKYGLSRNTGSQDIFSALLNGVSILRDEISKNFIYWHTHKDENGKDRPAIKKIILCGGDANLIGLVEYLSITMHQNIELANVWTNVVSSDKYIPIMVFEESLSYATAVGLALADFVDE